VCGPGVDSVPVTEIAVRYPQRHHHRFLGEAELVAVKAAGETWCPRVRGGDEVADVNRVVFIRFGWITDWAAGKQPHRPWRMRHDPSYGVTGVGQPPSHVDGTAQHHRVIRRHVIDLRRIPHVHYGTIGQASA
jgi:hypothetical protein